MKILFHITPKGEMVIDTVKGAGTNCKAAADKLIQGMGNPDEASRADTADLFEQSMSQDIDASSHS
jgi:hypothetical protein